MLLASGDQDVWATGGPPRGRSRARQNWRPPSDPRWRGPLAAPSSGCEQPPGGPQILRAGSTEVGRSIRVNEDVGQVH